MLYATRPIVDLTAFLIIGVSILLSLSRDLNLVQKIPAAENACSASTEVGGIVSSQLYTVCMQAPPSSA